MMLKVTVDTAAEQRLDHYLVACAELPTTLTRSQLHRLVQSGKITLNKKTVRKTGVRVKHGDDITVELEENAPEHLVEYVHALDILFEDSDIIVINKPPGLTMHPGAGTGGKTLLNALNSYYRGQRVLPTVLSNQGARGGIVHRLDKDTSGVLVVAKTLKALQNLNLQFSNRTISRQYVALAFSTPRASRILRSQLEGTVDQAVGRSPKVRIKMAIDGSGKKRAVTHWKVLERFLYGTLVELRLETGRTHQIRVHLEAIGSPVIGDRVYGNFDALPAPLFRLQKSFARQALHARTLAFIHPRCGELMEFSAAIPSDMQALIHAFKHYVSE